MQNKFQDSFNEIPLVLFTLFVIFLLLTIIVVTFLVRYQRRKYLYQQNLLVIKKENEQAILQAQLETQEETFATLGKELHDNVGQLLNSAKLLIGVTQRKLTDAPDTLSIADETLGTAINELRSLSKSLNKEWLQQFNFIDNLQTEIKRINAADSLQITFSYKTQLPFKSDKQIILFRIVQEALQNAIKHAQANNITIQLTEENNLLTVIVEDDGKGFEEKEKTATGIGLLNMKHRIKLLGGSIEWKSSNKGASVIILLPVKNETV